MTSHQITRTACSCIVSAFSVVATAVLPVLPATAAEAEFIVKLTASDAARKYRFGGAVAVSGDTVIVGASGKLFSGGAYIFERSEGYADSWGEVAKLIGTGLSGRDGFGGSVGIAGDTAIVGTKEHQSGPGSAFIFQRDQGGPDQWGEVIKLTASDPQFDARFGESSAIFGDTAIVGAPFENSVGLSSGSAYIFERNHGGPDNWGRVIKLIASDTYEYDRFGYSVSISGDTAIVGAWQDDDAGNNSGSAYVFERDHGGPNNWGEVAKLTASDAAAEDNFGYLVAVSGNTAIVSGPDNADAGDFSGSAYIFERDHGGLNNWGEVTKLTASDAGPWDFFSWGVAIDGDIAVVGALNDGNTGDGKLDGHGSAYVFTRNHGGPNHWGEVMKLTAPDGALGDHFGASPAVSGVTAILGASGNDEAADGAGAVYVFRVPEPSACILTVIGSVLLAVRKRKNCRTA